MITTTGTSGNEATLLWRVKDERLVLPTVLPVAAVWRQGDKIGGSIPNLRPGVRLASTEAELGNNSSILPRLASVLQAASIRANDDKYLPTRLAHHATPLSNLARTSEPVADRDLRAGREVDEVLAEEDVVLPLWGREERIAIS